MKLIEVMEAIELGDIPNEEIEERLSKLVEQGLLTQDGDDYRITEKGNRELNRFNHNSRLRATLIIAIVAMVISVIALTVPLLISR